MLPVGPGLHPKNVIRDAGAGTLEPAEHGAALCRDPVHRRKCDYKSLGGPTLIALNCLEVVMCSDNGSGVLAKSGPQ